MAAKEQGPGFTRADIERICNPGSYLKAVALVKQGAVKITGGCHGAEAQVQSERGTGHYTVRLGRCGILVNAKCSCVDARTRNGLCKHGAAVALVFLENGHDLPRMPISKQARARARPPAIPRKAEESPEVEEALPALKKPCFPTKAPVPATSFPVTAGKSAPVAKNFMLRRLNAAALAGDCESFTHDFRRMEHLSEEGATALLHKAILGNNAIGAETIVATLLERPEGTAVVKAGNFDDLRRTPLHAAVAANRLGMCRALLEASADVTQLDGNGLTALDLARRRKVDISKGDWRQREDPVQLFLQEAMKNKM